MLHPYVAQAGAELVILLPQPPTEYRPVPLAQLGTVCLNFIFHPMSHLAEEDKKAKSTLRKRQERKAPQT